MEHDRQQVSTHWLDTQRGIRVTKVTFFALLLAAVVEVSVSVLSGSAALLADSVHGLSNAFTTLPLWIAFSLGRKKATPQFPYGYHRAEDLAGIIIVIFIAVSAGIVGYESVNKLLEGEEPRYVPWAMGAGAVGFLINEVIAQHRIRVGKDIGSASLIADGHHARVDGLGSLAVVLGLTAVLLGFPIADPAVGLVITGFLVFLLVREAGPVVLSRIMDRIDPAILSEIENIASPVSGVRSVHNIRARWVGHGLLTELSVCVDPDLSVAQGHQIAEEVQHTLMHSVQKLQWCTIHIEPFEEGRTPTHEIIAHHYPSGSGDEDSS